MALGENLTYYDVLDLTPDASPQEVRDGYLRTKATYTKDSVALYTLIGSEEREEMLKQIEEAYVVLSNPEKRRDYDRYHGLLSSEDRFIEELQSPTPSRIRSAAVIEGLISATPVRATAAGPTRA